MFKIGLAIAFYIILTKIIKKLFLDANLGYGLYAREINYMRNPTPKNHEKMKTAYIKFCEDYHR